MYEEHKRVLAEGTTFLLRGGAKIVGPIFSGFCCCGGYYPKRWYRIACRYVRQSAVGTSNYNQCALSAKCGFVFGLRLCSRNFRAGDGADGFLPPWSIEPKRPRRY
jgi:hypothetical protein